MRVVLDSNVLLSAFGTHGLCEAVLTVCLADHALVLSEPILTEVAVHLQDKFRLPATEVHEVVSFLREHAEVVAPAVVAQRFCRDPNDCAVLGTVAAGKAGCLVSGDKDLLTLKEFHGVPILSPRQFYERLR